MSKWILVPLVFLFMAWFNSSASAERDSGLAGFISIKNTTMLERALKKGSEQIMIPQGKYIIDNPLVVDRSGLLFLFGAGRLRTELIARNPDQPLFVVRRLDRLVIAGIELTIHGRSKRGFLIEAVNEKPLQIDIQDSFFRQGGLLLGGPGRTVVQGSHFQGAKGKEADGVDYGIVVNHEAAELYVVAGNMTSHAHSHIFQRAGHVEVYGTGFQNQGAADIVLMAPSLKGAHIVAAVRSEGTNTHAQSVFLSVPYTEEPVDVVLKANNFTSPTLAPRLTRVCSLTVESNIFANYNAAGRIWVVGNFANSNVRHLVSGVNSASTVVAIGNSIKGCIDPLDPVADMFDIPTNALLVDIYNVFDYEAVSGNPGNPRRRFTSPRNLLIDYKTLLEIPENANGGRIPKLGRPVISEKAPKEFLRSVRDYYHHHGCRNAVDDTCYLQKALDKEGARLYFPAGTYRISKPLHLNQNGHDIGGMIAGAGSDVTRIICTCDSALVTDGMAYVTIQGITFSAQGDAGAVVSLEWPEKLDGASNPFVATQGNNFYDVRFDGGKYGLAIGRLSPRQCSENLVVNSKFTNSRIGLAVGQYNALANTLHGVRFRNTEWNIGFSDEGIGGTWAVFEAEATGTKKGIIYRFGIGRNLYHNFFYSDGPKLLTMPWNSNETIVFFDHSKFIPKSPERPFLDFNAGQGVIFLRSLVSDGELHIGGTGAASFILSLFSKTSNSVEIAPGVDCYSTSSVSDLRKTCFARFEKFGTK